MEFEDRKWRDRETLRHIINQWNTNRLDLFSLSEPNEDLEFHGVMRFYFQDAGQKIATKCVRVSSTASTQAVIETLIEKFRPDMKMLHMTEYALYEIHPNGEERRLGTDEKPLLVQLNWHKDDREGRFLLRRADEKSTLPATQPPEESSFRRKLSKREKRNLKKENKLRRMKSGVPSEQEGVTTTATTNKGSVAEKLYTELPETSFTRSISNPEAVMRRRRQQKLERKLQQFRSKDGGPDTGGTLKIYGESLCKDVPYKTLLLSVRETAVYVVREMLDKYGLDKEDPANYCLVQITPAPPGSNEPDAEYILEDEECPLAILMHHPPGQGPVMFHVRRRPADQAARRRKKKLSGSSGNTSTSTINRIAPGVEGNEDERSMLPFLLELNPDGSEARQGPNGVVRRHLLPPTVTEVGSERPSVPHPSSPAPGPSIQLFGPGIQPRHCIFAHTEGIVTLTPCSSQADTYVNGQRICETTLLQHGSVIRFGRLHQFRFIDPSHEFRTVPPATAQNYEKCSSRGPGTGSVSGSDPILPAVLELPEDVEDAFLHSLIPNLDTRQVPFRLAPTYALYLMARYRASTHFRPELNPMERAQRLTLTLSRVGAMMQAIVQERYADPPSLAFWMANASELLHFLKSDRHICAFSLDGQDLLAEAVQGAFRNLSVCLTGELLQSLPPMLSEREDLAEEETSTAQVLSVLSSTMGLLRRCRVNAALTIQLFSQLFHSLNAAIFNRLVGLESPRLPSYVGVNMCSRQWGTRLSRRLRRLEAWAERQGLELAADCHLARVMQAAHLLQAPKSTPEQLADVASSCFKLNSLQLRALLERYRPAPDEAPLPPQLVDAIVRVAEGTADELQLADGRPLRLEEDAQLAVPFLLPDDGYSCDVMRGIPTGLVDVLAPLQQAGLCRLTSQPTSSGHWTIYMGEIPQPVTPRAPSAAAGEQQPELQVLRLRKASDSMGLSIVAARGTGQQQLGVYIKSVVKGGSADIDGRLQAGDQLLSVDGHSLVGITQDRAAEILMRTGPMVTLEVAKQAAMFHGLATLLSQPSPTSTVSRSTLSINKERRPPLPQQPSHPGQHQQPYQERLVDWDRPPTSVGAPNRANSNSSPSLVAETAAVVPSSQNRVVALRNANSKSVPALHSEPAPGQEPPMLQSEPYPPHQQVINKGMANQRTLSAQHLPPTQHQQRYPAPQQPMYSPGAPNSPTKNQGYQYGAPVSSLQQQATRSRSVQNLTETQQQSNNRASLRARHPSNPSVEEERQYQNISLYQQQANSQPQYQKQQLLQTQQYNQQVPSPYLQQHFNQQPQNQQSFNQQQPNQQMFNAQHSNQHMFNQQIAHQQMFGHQQTNQQTYNQSQQSAHQINQQQQQQQTNRGLLSPVNRPAHLRGPSYAQQSESPPPPPPPPASTHPLLANQVNPWDREEKEREILRRQEAARIWMEEQIAELETLGSNRTTKQEEQLRTLKLEMEFRKRAQEAAKEEEDEDGDDDDEGTIDRKGMLRLVQEDLERARQWRLEKEQKQLQHQQQHAIQTHQHLPMQQQQHAIQQQQQQLPMQQQFQHQIPPQQQQIQQHPVVNGMNNNTSSVPDQERLRKIETFQRKQRELEATQAAEDRILREAQRRKEEEMNRQQWRPTAPGQRLDSLVSGPSNTFQSHSNPQSQSSNVTTLQSHLAVQGHIPIPNQPNPVTQPPSSTPTNIMPPNHADVHTGTTKRVSFFQDKFTTYDANANQEKPREDPDAFIQEAENMLATPKGGDQLLLTGSTPGVIGAQEIYRDPRLRRLAEQQQQKAQLKPPGPEKLTFQEKMRMFALESGEPATPKDKSKISKAQREIELKPSPQK